MSAPQLDMIDGLTGEEQGVLRRPGKRSARWSPKSEIEKANRIKFAKTLTTAANGVLVIKDVPATATILVVSPRTDGAVQRAITRNGTDVTVSFRVLQTGVISGLLTSLFVSSAPVTFDFLAIEPVG